MHATDPDPIASALALLDEQIRHLGNVIHGAEQALARANAVRRAIAQLRTEQEDIT